MKLFLPMSSAFEVSTGNFATVNDAVQRNPLGLTVDDADSSGRVSIYRYVKLIGTAKPALIVGPVYYGDDTFTTVTPTSTEGLTGLNFIAGVLENKDATYGNFVWIKVFGKVNMVVAALTAIGDALIGAAGNQATARVAAATAPTNTVLGTAITAVAATKSDVLVNTLLGGLV